MYANEKTKYFMNTTIFNKQLLFHNNDMRNYYWSKEFQKASDKNETSCGKCDISF